MSERGVGEIWRRDMEEREREREREREKKGIKSDRDGEWCVRDGGERDTCKCTYR